MANIKSLKVKVLKRPAAAESNTEMVSLMEQFDTPAVQLPGPPPKKTQAMGSDILAHAEDTQNLGATSPLHYPQPNHFDWKFSPALISTPNQAEFRHPLGGEKFLTSGVFQGNKRIHIRQFSNGIPTKKGLAMPAERVAALLYHMDTIEEQVQKLSNGDEIDFKLHIADGMYVNVASEYNTVSLRVFFRPAYQSFILPSKSGISLSVTEWSMLKEGLKQLLIADPDLAKIRPCFTEQNHADTPCSKCEPYQRMGY